MRRKEIQSGQVYTNDKGRYRLVYVFEGMRNAPYLQVVERKKGPRVEVSEFARNIQGVPKYKAQADQGPFFEMCTFESFASWAKRRATPEETRMVHRLIEDHALEFRTIQRMTDYFSQAKRWGD